eukprot:m.122126 g.122126  ORF g.122126 m.122126 type:complete len:693 (-) comp19651_c0_seq1:23-2101(-)
MFRLCVVVAVLVATAEARLANDAGVYTNPLFSGNRPDPGAFRFTDGLFYVVTTTGSKGNDYPILSSPDLVHWTARGYVFPGTNTQPVWAVDEFWAPELHQLNNETVVLYFAAQNRAGQRCVGACTAPHPLGPFLCGADPLVPTQPHTENIDPTYVAAEGRRYLVWKVALAQRGQQNSTIKMRELEESGTAFVPNAPEIALISNDMPFEGILVEAPWIVFYKPYYYLFYSSNAETTPQYNVAVARSTSVTGPYQKLGHPILATNNGTAFEAPGHCSVLDLDGNLYIIYHAYAYGQIEKNVRLLMMDAMFMNNSTGWPYLANNGTPSSFPVPAPVIPPTPSSLRLQSHNYHKLPQLQPRLPHTDEKAMIAHHRQHHRPSSEGLPAGTYTNPVKNGNRPDPGAFRYKDGLFYVATTSGDAPDAYPIMVSKDLANWEQKGYVFPSGTWPVWANKDLWAPELHQIDNQTVGVYFAARNKRGVLCVGVCTSTHPLGPYHCDPSPLVEEAHMGNIDPTFIRDGEQRYLIWKTDGNGHIPPVPTPINLRPLVANGTAFVPGSSTTVLIKNDLPFEGSLVEAPWVLFQPPYYFLFYSSNGFSSPKYNIAAARARNITGPYVKYGQPMMATGSSKAFEAPGHCSVLGVGSEVYMLYHAYPYGKISEGNRNLLLDRLEIDKNGWPQAVSGGTPSSTPQPLPPA